MSHFVEIAVLLGVGWWLRRRRVFGAEAAEVLGDFVIYVALPALILVGVPELEFAPELAVLAVLPWVVLGVAAAAVLGLSRLLGWSRETTGALLLLVPLGNTSFVGFPMIHALFGSEFIPLAVIYDQSGSFLTLVTYGTFVLAAYGGAERPTVRGVLSRIVRFPPFLALLGAVVLAWTGTPTPLRDALQHIGDSLVPVIMVAVGTRLELRPPGDVVGPLAVGLGLKLVAIPLLALAACTALGLDGDPTRIAVFEAGMPPMITAGILAMQADLAPRLSAAMIGFGIVLSLVTLPLLGTLL